MWSTTVTHWIRSCLDAMVNIGYSSLACASDRSPFPRLCFPRRSTCTDLSTPFPQRKDRRVEGSGPVDKDFSISRCYRMRASRNWLRLSSGYCECVCVHKNTMFRPLRSTGEGRWRTSLGCSRSKANSHIQGRTATVLWPRPVAKDLYCVFSF